jgi:hypothetical protein
LLYYNIEEYRYFTRDFLETRAKITIGDLSSILSFHQTYLDFITFEIWSEKNAKIWDEPRKAPRRDKQNIAKVVHKEKENYPSIVFTKWVVMIQLFSYKISQMSLLDP